MAFEMRYNRSNFDCRDLIWYFRLFCWAHEIEEPEDLIEKFKIRAEMSFESLMKGNLDYRPYMGAKFFVNFHGNLHVSHGYCHSEDCDCPERHRKRYENALKEYHRQKKLF